jgi:hypothetical protein
MTGASACRYVEVQMVSRMTKMSASKLKSADCRPGQRNCSTAQLLNCRPNELHLTILTSQRLRAHYGATSDGFVQTQAFQVRMPDLEGWRRGSPEMLAGRLKTTRDLRFDVTCTQVPRFNAALPAHDPLKISATRAGRAPIGTKPDVPTDLTPL